MSWIGYTDANPAVKEGNIGITTKKGKSIELTHKTSGKEIVVVNSPSVLKKYKKLGFLISMPEGKLTEKSAISLNLWVKEFERLAKKNKMNPVDFVKKHIEKRKGMDNEVVKNVLKHFQKNEGKLTEAKKIKYKTNDWKKINKLAKKKDVMIQTAFGDEFKWEEGSREGVFASESDGREIELTHDDIDILVVY